MADPEGKRLQVALRILGAAARRTGIVLVVLCAVIGAAGLAGAGWAVWKAGLPILHPRQAAREAVGIAADSILANTPRPTDREMPPTATWQRYAAMDIQAVGGMGKGLSCSVPDEVTSTVFPRSGTIAPIALQMRQACVFHDYCYRHGAATYGYAQADCDFFLQEQAYRLCTAIQRANAREGRPRTRSDWDCQRDARVVTLGVRVGGAGSFRPARAFKEEQAPAREEPGDGLAGDQGFSSFFEFDPYPVRAQPHEVFRIADAPPALPGAGKVLYRFAISQSGMIISVARRNPEKPDTFEPYERIVSLPAQPGTITTPPMVIRRVRPAAAPDGSAGDDGAEAIQNETVEDWFVWWQRWSLAGTGGRFVAIAPGRATAGDWLCVNPPVLPPPGEEQIPHCPTESGALMVAEIGFSDENPDDGQFSELLPADLGSAAGRGLSMMALRPHGCRQVAGENAPCIVHVVVDPIGQPRQPQEPLSLRDMFAPDRGAAKPRVEADRYRNFAGAPLVLNPPGADDPVLAWTRRPDVAFETTAFLRRFGVDKTGATSAPLGTVELVGFAEEDEPAFVLGRSLPEPRLAAFRDLRPATSGIALRQWPLPPTRDPELVNARDIAFPDAPPACSPRLDAAFLQRPPIVIGQGDGSTLVVFTRGERRTGVPGFVGALQIATLAIARDGTCPARPRCSPVIGMLASGTEDSTETAAVKIRSSPVLVGTFGGAGAGELQAVLANEAGRPIFLSDIPAQENCLSTPVQGGGL